MLGPIANRHYSENQNPILKIHRKAGKPKPRE